MLLGATISATTPNMCQYLIYTYREKVYGSLKNP